MQLIIQHPEDHALTLFRRAGYSFQYEKDGETSFIRTLASGGYPRFHCYTKNVPTGIECSIHLDQKRETYGKTTRHHGEYADDGALGDEIGRLKNLFGSLERLGD